VSHCSWPLTSACRAHLIRAVLRGCAFGLRYNLDAVRSAGVEVDELRVCGGAAASDLWVQMITVEIARLTCTEEEEGVYYLIQRPV